MREGSRLKTKVIKVGNRPPASALREAAEVLDLGGVAGIPTDTVYGLAAGAFRPQAVARIYRLKGRSYKKPLPFLVADFARAAALVEPISSRLRALLDRYWPGPLTVVFKTSSLGRWVTGGKDTIAVRIPRHPAALALLKALDYPLATTSANPSGKPPAASGAATARMFAGRVPLILDAGRCPVGEASTVLDAAHWPWTLVREGAVKKEELARYL
jgi:L-threonylcarbamoyladenylate synthase